MNKSFKINFELHVVVMVVLAAIAYGIGHVCWTYTTGKTKKWRYEAIVEAPSPFLMTLTNTASDPQGAEGGLPNLTDDNQARLFLQASIKMMALRSPENRPLRDDEVSSLTDVVIKTLKVKPSEVFGLSGTETIVKLILNNEISKVNDTQDGAAFKAWNRLLIDGLQEEHAIVKSSELLGELVKRKLIPIASMASAAGAIENDTAAGEAGRQWMLMHQLALRGLQRVQNHQAIRDTRFMVTFVEGYDVLAMWFLFWFVILVTLVRWDGARRERAYSIGDASITKRIDDLRDQLVIRNFSTVMTDIGAIRKAVNGKTPVFLSMLDVVENELVLRKRRAQPDSLLVWAHSVREELASSRWLLGWCGRALPTVGFIAKVLGIARAMKDSDTIALATGSLEQAASISNVSGALGLAFSATFVAFALSLGIGLIEAWEAHYERSVIATLEHKLVKLLTVP